jgi:cholesterol oxidase
MSREHFDAIIVGSGFGGSVTAQRLAEAGLSVCLLERGKAYPPGSFPRTPDGMRSNFWNPSEQLYGMFNIWSFRHLEALVSSGLGGGSLIYANVLLRKDEKWFVREEPGTAGYEHWPVTRAELDPHYDRVERGLNAQRYPFEHAPYDRTPKTLAMKEAAGRLGLDWILPPLAVTFANEGGAPVTGEPIREEHRNLHDRTRYTCRLCGECDAGCNYGSKNTLDYNYLSEAKRLGAELKTLCEVVEIAPNEPSGYTVRYRTHVLDEASRKDAPLTTITADRLILSAGTLGSTFLLLKNRANFPKLSPALGSHFCGNGDLLTFAIRGGHKENGKRVARVLDPNLGPVITSAIRLADELDGAKGRGAYIEDAGYPAFISWLLETAGIGGALKRMAHFAWTRVRTIGRSYDTNMGADISALLGPCELSSGSLPLLGMGRDIPDGVLELDEGWLQSRWKIDRSTAYFTRLRNTMREITESWGARYEDNPSWHLGRRVITVHALGGCPMGRNETEGVVDSFGEVFGYPGLHVADGSVMPGPVGANPALTIAALADRGADHLLEQHFASRPRRSTVTSAIRAVGS